MPQVNEGKMRGGVSGGTRPQEDALTAKPRNEASAGTNSPIARLGSHEPYGHLGAAGGVDRTRGQSDNRRLRR
jgi:hypothetical protein